jgi:hypothetical protein
MSQLCAELTANPVSLLVSSVARMYSASLTQRLYIFHLFCAAIVTDAMLHKDDTKHPRQVKAGLSRVVDLREDFDMQDRHFAASYFP